MMVAVALAAVATVGGLRARGLYRWSQSYQDVADQRERVRATLAKSAKVFRNPATRQAVVKQAEWYAASRDTYARAAKMPWVTVPDDRCPSLDELMRDSGRDE